MFSGINKTPVNRPLQNTQPTRQGAKTTIGSIKTLFNKLACNLLGCKNQVENTPIDLESPKQNRPTDDSSNEQISKLPADATRNVLTFLDSDSKNSSVAKVNKELRSLIHEQQTLLKLRGDKLALTLNELDSYPNVQHIRITETPSAEDIQRIVNAQSSRQILSLDLGWCTSLTDEAICMLAEKCPDITSLNLSYCGQISDAGLAAVAEHCPHLKTLDLSWCNKLTDESIETLANKCQNLVSLNISGCMNISSAAITALIAACPNLKSLRT
jgi:F-box and leucine-rich repeat protein 2/20